MLLLFGLLPGALVAQDPLESDLDRPAARIDDWGLAVTPYAWFAAQSTDVGGQAIRQSFNDLASITNLGFQARVLARWRWLRSAADWTNSDTEANQVGALFRVSRRLMISAGYRQFKYQRTDGEGEDEVKQTVAVVGPAVGLSIGISREVQSTMPNS